MKKSKNFIISYYKEVISFQIRLAISIIKEIKKTNQFTYQLHYWFLRLTDSLQERKQFFQDLKNFNEQNEQLTLF